MNRRGFIEAVGMVVILPSLCFGYRAPAPKPLERGDRFICALWGECELVRPIDPALCGEGCKGWWDIRQVEPLENQARLRPDGPFAEHENYIRQNLKKPIAIGTIVLDENTRSSYRYDGLLNEVTAIVTQSGMPGSQERQVRFTQSLASVQLLFRSPLLKTVYVPGE